jgi:hypothetical protein
MSALTRMHVLFPIPFLGWRRNTYAGSFLFFSWGFGVSVSPIVHVYSVHRDPVDWPGRLWNTLRRMRMLEGVWLALALWRPKHAYSSVARRKLILSFSLFEPNPAPTCIHTS